MDPYQYNRFAESHLGGLIVARTPRSQRDTMLNSQLRRAIHLPRHGSILISIVSHSQINQGVCSREAEISPLWYTFPLPHISNLSKLNKYTTSKRTQPAECKGAISAIKLPHRKESLLKAHMQT